jgi:hypothetical protein
MPAARRGQVLVVVLLLCLPLSVLLLAVARSGPATRDRMQLQTAADAAALAGATWSARACNLLAQAHETTSQLAAGIALLRAVKPARKNAEAVLDALAESGRASPEAIAAERKLLKAWEEELADFIPLAEPGNPGGLWAAAETVESLCDALLQSLPRVAAEDAETIGRENGAASVVVWPAHPELPVEEAPVSVLEEKADDWLRRGMKRLTTRFTGPLLSDPRSLYETEAEATLQEILADTAFPAHPLAWRGDAREALDVVAFAVGTEDDPASGVAFAQARPANPERGDLMTPAWVARLVPADRAGSAMEELALRSRRGPSPAGLRLSPETVDALTCH